VAPGGSVHAGVTGLLSSLAINLHGRLWFAGPVFDVWGRVIGIYIGGWSTGAGFVAGVGLALPIAVIARLVDQVTAGTSIALSFE
jgi:hypothetical protein